MTPVDGGGGGTISLRAFARHRGVSPNAVSKAFKSGRLKRSITVDDAGRPAINDIDLADREWEANAARPQLAPPPRARQVAPVRRDEPAAAPPPSDDTAEPPQQTDVEPVQRELNLVSLSEAQRIVTIERAKKLEMENSVTSGQLVEKSRVLKEAFEATRIIREAILNLPARLAGALAAESDTGRVFLLLDAGLREALETGADRLLAAVSE